MVQVTVRDSEVKCTSIEAVKLGVIGGLIGSPFAPFGFTAILLLFRFDGSNQLIHRRQLFRFAVEPLELMATDATHLLVKLFSAVQYAGEFQDDIVRVALLAAGFNIFLGKQRPQPMPISTMPFLDAAGGAAVAVMARRAAEQVRVVNLKQFEGRMAGKGGFPAHVLSG